VRDDDSLHNARRASPWNRQRRGEVVLEIKTEVKPYGFPWRSVGEYKSFARFDRRLSRSQGPCLLALPEHERRFSEMAIAEDALGQLEGAIEETTYRHAKFYS